jgi:hypothetical protein
MPSAFFATDPGNRQQATGNRQQATGNRQQATGNRQQATGNRQQATGNYTLSGLNRVNHLTALFFSFCKNAGFPRTRKYRRFLYINARRGL